MTNFVYDNLALPNNKSDVNPITVVDQQWGAADANAVFQALKDIRTAIIANAVNVKQYGVVGDGVTDDTAALQAAVTAAPGRTLYLPRGKYKVTSTIQLSARGNHWVGDFPGRAVDNGTQIGFTGSGPCLQIGTDDGNPWNANEYNGPQGHIFQSFAISHDAPDTTLVAANQGATPIYKAGATGIADWRGGNVVIQDMLLERFEVNFFGIQSDINGFARIVSQYSKFGLYIGPRSDQNTIDQLNANFCDRAITIDGAGKTRVTNAQIVGCGTSTCGAIEVRKGSYGVDILSAWLEHEQGYAGTDQLSFVSIGEVDGYGAGGSVSSPGGLPNTASVVATNIITPVILTTAAAQVNHTKYLASVNKCQRFFLDAPVAQANLSLTNFDAIVGVQASSSPSAADTQIEVRGVAASLAIGKIFTNLGAGSPAVSIQAADSSGQMVYSTSRFHFKTIGASAGADDVQVSQEGTVGEIWLGTPNKPTGQTTRLRIARSQQITFVANGPPTAGTWEVGDRVIVLDQTQTGYSEFYCWIAGTPGVWAPANRIEGRELTPTILGASQNDYNPTSWSSSKVILLSASTPVSITGLLAPPLMVASASLVGLVGTEKTLYNTSANAITLTHQDALSAAGNRIIGRSGANTVLTQNTSVDLYYSPSLTRWLVTSDTL